MREADVYLEQITTASQALDTHIAELSPASLGQRPGPSLNPVRWNYWHLLRVWDVDLNWIAKSQSPDQDAWHRGGFSERSGYEPSGKGVRGMGIGTGYTDADVDGLDISLDVLKAYHQQLLAETEAYLKAADEAALTREIPPLPGRQEPATVAARFQHLIGHSWNHIGELRYAKGMLGYHDPSYPGGGS